MTFNCNGRQVSQGDSGGTSFHWFNGRLYVNLMLAWSLNGCCLLFDVKFSVGL